MTGKNAIVIIRFSKAPWSTECVRTFLLRKVHATYQTVQGLCLQLRHSLSLSAAALLLPGVVVHSLQQQEHLNVHGLREQIHGHGSHRTERGPMNSVGWRSAQTKRQKNSNHIIRLATISDIWGNSSNINSGFRM